MMDRLLSFLFPPKLPGRIRDWGTRVDPDMVEEGSAGPAKPKRYRNGIERFYAENAPVFSATWSQYHRQLLEAEKLMEATTQKLIAQGYVHVIHDCWEQEVENR